MTECGEAFDLEGSIGLLNRLSLPCCLLDREAQVIFANEALSRLFTADDRLAVSVGSRLSECLSPGCGNWFLRELELMESGSDRAGRDGFIVVPEQYPECSFEVSISTVSGSDLFLLSFQKQSNVVIEHKIIEALRAELGDALVRGEGLKALLKLCTDALVRYLDLALARVYIFDELNQMLVMQASSGPLENTKTEFYRIPIGKWKVGKTGLERKAHWCCDLLNDPDVADKDWVRNSGVNTFGAVPLVAGQRLVGVISLAFKTPVSPLLRSELSSLCDYLAFVVESHGKARLEEQLSNLVQASQEAITVRDLSGRIIHWNKAATQIYGYDESEAVGMDFMRLVPPELVDEQNKLHASILSGELVGHLETLRTRKNGVKIPVSLTCIPLLDGLGEKFAVCTITCDLTEQKLRVSQAAEIQLLKEREDFLYTLTHDLKGPLLGVQIICQQLQDGDYGQIPEESGMLLSKVRQNNTELILLIQNIIDVYRYERDSGDLEVDFIDVLVLLSRCISDIAEYADSKQVKINLQASIDSMPVCCDQMAICRVFDNLLQNAVKFSSMESVVNLKMELSENCVILDFESVGEHLSESEQLRLFERFWQGSRSKKQTSGSGLGLYLSRKIIRAHGGDIIYLPLADFVNVFRVSLPLKQSETN